MKNLSDRIQDFNQSVASKLPKEILDGFSKSIIDLKEKQIEKNALQVGDVFPSFELKNSADQLVFSKEILQQKTMVIAFYRGSWCPYCNLQLRALQEFLPKIQEKNAMLLAVSPQSLSHASDLKEKNQISYDLLWDQNNQLARKTGIVFQLQDFVLSHYQTIGKDISSFNQNKQNEVPIPAVFVVEKSGLIKFRFVDSDYTKRLVIQEMIDAL